MSRRDLLRRAGLLAAGLTAGCTPVRMLLGSHPQILDRECGKTDAVLAAFVETVAPAEAPPGPGAVAAFANPTYGFAPYRTFFAGDLCRRSRSRFGTQGFDRLAVPDRERVVEEALRGDSISKRLYQGAIFLAQLSVYGGIADGEEGTPGIRFEGANSGFDREEFSYPNAATWLARPRTPSGNPA